MKEVLRVKCDDGRYERTKREFENQRGTTKKDKHEIQ